MFYTLAKSLLFKLQPETAHDLVLKIAHLSPALGKLSGISFDQRLSIRVGSTSWSFPIGLAAGLDKNAEALDFLAGQGFGALEAGTITLMPQEGNPKPRMFRIPEEASLRNSMGFPNKGLAVILPKLKRFDGTTTIGANIGKNKDTSPENSIHEIKKLFEELASNVDYLVINVSSPNTPGLRALQEKGYLTELFSELKKSSQKRDLYLKLSPDLEKDKLSEIAKLAADFKLTGLIGTNTTIMSERGAGGISGHLLKSKAKDVRDTLLQMNLPLEIIGVGGFENTQDLFDFWSSGGKAAQVYTSYIYQGPALIKNISNDIYRLMDVAKLKDLESFFALSLKERQEIIKEFQPA